MNAHSRTKSKSRRIVDDRRRPRLLEEGNERRTQEVSRSDVDLGLSGKVLPYKQKNFSFGSDERKAREGLTLRREKGFGDLCCVGRVDVGDGTVGSNVLRREVVQSQSMSGRT